MSTHGKPKGLEHELWVPAEDDYHGHPNYLKIYIYLLVLFAITVFASLIPNPMIVFIVVFSVSIIKASMVILYFMHLKWEPDIIWYMLLLALITLAFLLIGLYPDTVPIESFFVPNG